MENTLYIGLSRQMVLRRQLTVAANNMANINTPGFKAQQMLFQEHMAEPDTIGPSRGRESRMVLDQAVVRDMRAGPMERTGNPLDVGITGEGYLVVDTFGGPRYTRNGHLAIDASGRLVDMNGLPVLDTQNQPIEIPQGSRDITISASGAISTDAGPLAQLSVVRFENELGLTALGGGLYVANERPVPVDNPSLAQGMIEGSNVQPITEMTQMIEIMRQYQSTQKMLESEHERQQTAIRRLAKTQA